MGNPMLIGKWAASGLSAFTLLSCSLLFDAEELKTGAATGGEGGHGLESGAGGSSGSAPTDAANDNSGCPTGYGDCCADGKCAPEELFTFPTPSSGSEFPTFIALHAGSLYAVFHGAQGGVWRIDEVAQAFKPAVKVLTKPSAVDVAPLTNGLVVSATYSSIWVEGKNPFDLVTTDGWGLDVSGSRLAVTTAQQVLVFDIPKIVLALEVPGTSVAPSTQIETGSVVLDVTIAGNEYCYTQVAGLVGCTSWAGPLGVTPPPYAMVNDGTYVYWTEAGSGGGSYGVQRALIAPLSGPNPPTAERVMSGGFRAHGLTLTSGKLFAAMIGGNGDAIVEADVTGAGRRELVRTPHPFGVVVDDTFVYYSSWDGVFRLRR